MEIGIGVDNFRGAAVFEYMSSSEQYFNQLSFAAKIRLLEHSGIWLTVIDTQDKINGESLKKVLYALAPENYFCEVWFTTKGNRPAVVRGVQYGELDKYLPSILIPFDL